MDLLIHPELFKCFLSNRSKFCKSEEERTIDALLNNVNNRLIISKALLNKVEQTLSGDIVANALLATYMPFIINNNSYNVKATDESTVEGVLDTMENEYQKLTNNTKRDLFFVLYKSYLGTDEKTNVLCLNRMKKPNIDWLFINLACVNPSSISVRYYDFKFDREIQDFFEDVLEVNKNAYVDIFDKQVNLNHSLFDSIKIGKPVNYFTSFKRYSDEEYDKVQDIKSHFRRVFIYRGPKNQIHERRIMVENLIIEPDDDFWNLCCDRTTWKIMVTYCPKTASKISEKKHLFKRIN